ncbi:HAMP domain-containing sensor histidine kinase [Microbispora hainanensis]|uniref:sensor histidine kinase n=1 Tax=Microbispora hainanensis TaxID=568844 RepID=UPI0033F687E0
MPRRSSITARTAPAHGVAAVLPCLAAATIRLSADHPPATGPAPHNGAALRALHTVPTTPAYEHPVVLLVVICGALLLAGAVAYLGFRLTGRMVLPPPAPPAEPEEAEPEAGEPEESEPEEGDETERDETERDETERDETEAAGAQRQAPALGVVDGLAPGVNRTLGQLEEALERQRRFSSDASHELRTPMTAMRTQIEDALHAPQETDVVTLARALLPSLDRLQRIATDLLALSQLESDALPVRRQRVDLGKLAEGELQMLPITKRVVPLLGPDVVVLGDPHSLGSLISNLIGNAQRHAAGTVTVTVRREPREPHEPGGSPGGSSGGSPGGTAVLEVADDGPGIPSEQREKVFQRFTRLDSARSRDAGGAGLGLAIARQVAQNHGGRLTIEDSAEGARFVLRLPLAP